MFEKGKLIQRIEAKVAQLEQDKMESTTYEGTASYEIAISNLYIALTKLYIDKHAD